MRSFYIYTLGCKVNRFESEAIAELLCATGRYEPAPEEERFGADVAIVNSCAVTEESVKKVRKLIRRIRRENPGGILLLCGCVPQASPETAREMGADLICGNKDRSRYAALLDRYFPEEAEPSAAAAETELPAGPAGKRTRAEAGTVCAVEPHRPGETFEILAPHEYRELTRANLKIQDGCSRFCAYCIIPYARGPVRSMPLAEVSRQARRLTESGHREIVLTGINLGLYGTDIGSSLAEAAEAVSRAGAERIRLGSLEIDLITDSLLERFAAIPGFCPHFHASLQSGSDTVLARMDRRYNTAEYLRILGRIRQVFDNPSVTTDMIVGFPGETEAEFRESLAFCGEAGFFRIHVFPYSLRKGTKAAAMPDQVPETVKKERAALLAAEAERLHRAFCEKQIGKTHRVLFETAENGFACGHTENYLYVKVPAEARNPALSGGEDSPVPRPETLKNRIREVRITGTDRDGSCFAALCSCLQTE